jgi:Fe-S cluster assembly protein SufA/iron-sulfur cluster assembly protein
VTVQVVDPRAPELKASPRAIAHLKRQLQRSGAAAVRLAVKESGCSGYMYELDFVEKPADDADVMQDLDGVAVVVAKDQLPLIRGTEIDYVVNGLNASVKFRNPHAENECGCGESFSLATEEKEA